MNNFQNRNLKKKEWKLKYICLIICLTDLLNATGVDTWKYAKKVDLAHLKSNADRADIDKVTTNLRNLKSKLDKLDVDKLGPIPLDFSKLSDIVKNDVLKKDVYNAKSKNIEDVISGITSFATNVTINAKLNEVNSGMPSIANLTTNYALIGKINEFKSKTSNITTLATTTALTAVDNKV